MKIVRRLLASITSITSITSISTSTIMMIFEFHLISKQLSYALKIYIHLYVLLDFDIFFQETLSQQTTRKSLQKYKYNNKNKLKNGWKN